MLEWQVLIESYAAAPTWDVAAAGYDAQPSSCKVFSTVQLFGDQGVGLPAFDTH
jgi:hypothetical protein